MQYVDRLTEQLELSQYNDNKLVSTLSEKTKQRPEHISLAIFVLSALLVLLTPWGNRVLMVVLTFLYPSYKSFSALESAETADDKKWLTYWVVFGIFTAFKDVILALFFFVPAINLLLTIGLFTLYCPLTNYYVHVYEYVFRPLLKTYQGRVQKYIDMAKEEMADKLNKGKKVVVEELVK